LNEEKQLVRRIGFKSAQQPSIYLVAAIEGAQGMAKAQQSREPIDVTLKHLEYLLAT
jgi:hypothetical protein